MYQHFNTKINDQNGELTTCSWWRSVITKTSAHVSLWGMVIRKLHLVWAGCEIAEEAMSGGH